MAHVSASKKELVEKLVKEFGQSQVVGIVNIQGIPAAQFQKMRRKLRDKVNLRVTKSNLLAIALETAAAENAGLNKLKDAISGQSAVVTANINPFKLFREMEATKTKAPAKGGEVAPDDIWIREGETPFKPGPVVGDLQKAGIPAAIEKGKVVIKKEKLLVPKGEKIPRLTAQALTRLEIFPITVGLDLRGAFEEGMFYGRDVLAIDEAKILADIQTAGLRAFNLSVNVGYPTKATIRPILGKAHTDALNLAVNAGIPTKESLPLILAKAQASMLTLASLASVDLSAAKKTKAPEPTAEARPEAHKEEKKKGKKEEKKGTGHEAKPGQG